MKTITPDAFKRVRNDTYGNPRYVCHFLELDIIGPDKSPWLGISERYTMACILAKKAGGRKFHNKQYGGGIVFQSYSLPELCKTLNNIMAKEVAA